MRNNDAFKDKETRYQKLMNKVIREGVKTKVLMLSATPVNNRFNDLRNQLALAYEGDSENLSKKLRTSKSVEEVFRNAQKAFNAWAKLPPEQRTARAILDALDFDFFELLDSVTIARSRKHIQTFYDTKDIGHFPERRKPLSFHAMAVARVAGAEMAEATMPPRPRIRCSFGRKQREFARHPICLPGNRPQHRRLPGVPQSKSKDRPTRRRVLLLYAPGGQEGAALADTAGEVRGLRVRTVCRRDK